MPPKDRPESSAGLSPPDTFNLPAFTDRLPDLVQALRTASRELKTAGLNQSYLPYWEDVYAVAHSLKGVLTILRCPPDLADFIVRFTASLSEGLAGASVCRELKRASLSFAVLAEALDGATLPEPDFYADWLATFTKLYALDIEHEARMSEVPSHLVYVSEQVSKKAREISLLKLNQCVVEDIILLDEIPLWRTRLNEALLHPDLGRGLLVNFLPFISSEGSQKLNVWAWVAAATHSRAALKARVKEVMPEVSLKQL